MAKTRRKPARTKNIDPTDLRNDIMATLAILESAERFALDLKPLVAGVERLQCLVVAAVEKTKEALERADAMCDETPKAGR